QAVTDRVRSLNTNFTESVIYAPVGRTDNVDPRTTIFSPHPLMHIGGIYFSLLMPLSAGATTVITDIWDPQAVVPFLVDAKITYLGGGPAFQFGVLDALKQQSRHFAELRIVRSGSTTIPQLLVTQVAETYGVSLGVMWGMTEGVCSFTRPDDPPGWATVSVGRPGPGTETDLRADHPISDARPARLYVRGGSLCLATLGRDDGQLTELSDWYDTGDLAVPDGRGGIRLLGRAVDRIGSTFMIPVNDVESALLEHAEVQDVALVGYPDGHGGELACAVVVPRADAPALRDLRDHLTGQGMTEWYLPSRLELFTALPRNEGGKVRKDLLRQWLEDGQARW
ncbi:AMP-binding protein, partial [Kibdelosporangium philippinense]